MDAKERHYVEGVILKHSKKMIEELAQSGMIKYFPNGDYVLVKNVVMNQIDDWEDMCDTIANDYAIEELKGI